MKILIVDDEAPIGRAMSRLLTSADHETRVRTSPSAITAEDYAWADVVLTDWDMPDGGGAAVIACCGRTPWVVLSGNDVVVDGIRAAGGTAVSKPASLVEITAAIVRALRVCGCFGVAAVMS